jgi:molybdopterin-guanine dinucleotide biosynthesis protein A
VVLAGGAGKRLGGAKAEAVVAGRPLLGWALERVEDLASEGLLSAAVIACKADTRLPDVGATPVWFEPDEPRHPLAGIVHALRCAEGRDVVVVAVDLPLVTAATVRALAGAPPGMAVVAGLGEEIQPLLGRYSAEALPALEAAIASGARTLDAVRGLEPQVIEVTRADELLNVNEQSDLAKAERLLGIRPA